MSSKSRTTNATPLPDVDHATPGRFASNRAVLLGLFVIAALAGAGLLFMLRETGGVEDKNKLSIQYVDKTGKGISEGVPDAPLTMRVRIPWLTGSPDTMLAGVTLQLLDASGQPADFGGKRGPLPMRSTTEIEVWEYVGSVPSKPGVYHAEARLIPFTTGEQTQTQTQTFDLRDPLLNVVADDALALRSGYVLGREDDLWMLSTDGNRERRLTFFAPSQGQEYANDPAWSPDGKRVAFAYSPPIAGGEVQRSEIWSVDSDGSGLARLVGHGPNEALYSPAWSPDGKTVIFTVETVDAATGGSLSYRTDRVDLATGARSEVTAGAESATFAGPGGEVVYIESVPLQEGSLSSSGQRIVMASADGSNKRSLVSENQYPTLYAPRVSPDGKWLVFASVNQNPTTPTPTGFNLLKWLMLEPETASAHGIPWELYIVPTSGRAPLQPTQLTSLNEDEPYPAWHDNTTLSLLGLKGLYTVDIDAQGKAVGAPRMLGEGVQHGKLTWHGP